MRTWKVDSNAKTQKFYISVTEPCECGCPNCKGTQTRPHTSGNEFDEYEDAEQWLEDTLEHLQECQERYEEQNSYAIRQSELYEMFRNEY